ncbi:MAG: phosphatase PAP2 family protein [Chloroflexota bacterium]
MFEALENGIGLDIILWLQENRTAWMETLSIILDQLGYDLGYVALFGIIFWTINKRHGVRMVFALVVIALLTFFFKDLLGRPRPFVASELVMPVFETSGFGLPSGHTSLAVMIWGYVALWVRKGWVWGLAITYMILQGLGRMVAGVHYPQDVFFGALLAIITLALYYPLATQWETLWHKQPFLSQIAISLAIPMIITGIVLSVPLTVEQIEAYLTILGLAMGAGIGAAIEANWVKFSAHEDASRQAMTVVIGIVLVLGVLFGLSPLFDAISETGTTAYVLRLVRYGAAGLVAIAIVPLLCVQLGLMHSENTEPEPIPTS